MVAPVQTSNDTLNKTEINVVLRIPLETRMNDD